jgi:hypothetical protein
MIFLTSYRYADHMAQYTEFRMGAPRPRLSVRLLGSLQTALLWACMSIITASLVFLVAQLGMSKRVSEITTILPEALTWLDFIAGNELQHYALLYFKPDVWWLSCLCIVIPVHAVTSIAIRKS